MTDRQHADETSALLAEDIETFLTMEANDDPLLRRSLESIPTGKRARGRHHRVKTSISQLYDSFKGELGVIGEEVAVEGSHLRETFKDELKKAIIPDQSELEEFAVETAGPGVADKVHEAPPQATLIARYLSLLLAVLAVSSNGTALSLLHGVHPALKLYWRMTATAAALSFFAVRSYLKKPLVLTRAQMFTFAGAVLCFTLHGLLFYTALTMTSIGNAVIAANSQALLLILGKFLVGEKVEIMEAAGVVIAFGGCGLCTADEAREKGEDPNADASQAIIGDLLAFGSAMAGVGYLTFARSVRPHMSVTMFMFLMMLCGSFVVTLYLLMTGVPITFSTDPDYGLFGWLSIEQNRLYIILFIAIMCNLVGFMGFVRAMAYFDNITIAVSTLLEPMVATMIAYAMHVGELPGPLGWTGNALVIAGTLLVVYPSIDKPMEH